MLNQVLVHSKNGYPPCGFVGRWTAVDKDDDTATVVDQDDNYFIVDLDQCEFNPE